MRLNSLTTAFVLGIITNRKGGNNMAENVSNVSFRIDSDLKAQADNLFAALGLNMTTAFNIFLRQSVRQGCIPFDITFDTPDAETIAALLEARQMMADPDTKKHSVGDALKELKT